MSCKTYATPYHNGPFNIWHCSREVYLVIAFPRISPHHLPFIHKFETKSAPITKITWFNTFDKQMPVYYMKRYPEFRCFCWQVKALSQLSLCIFHLLTFTNFLQNISGPSGSLPTTFQGHVLDKTVICSASFTCFVYKIQSVNKCL